MQFNSILIMQILKKETYTKMIENSIGTRLFNSIIVTEYDIQKDILNDGEFSCACFVSGILFLQNVIPRTRTTVTNLEKDLLENPLMDEVAMPKNIRAGDIIFWESVTYEDGSSNRHVGFALSNIQAVSTNYIQKCVVRHSMNTAIENTGEVRKIERVFRPVFK